MNSANQRTRQTINDGYSVGGQPRSQFVDYTYDDIGQLKTAKGKESGGSTARLNEQFGYAYDAAWNLNYRTNNALTQTFSVDNKNQLTTAARSGTLTVAGQASQPGANLTSVTVSGTGLTTGSATVYADGSWAKAGAAPASSGNSTYTATAVDTSSRTASDSVTVSLPTSVTYSYDGNGNLTSDGRRSFEYDYENQLTNVYVASAWRSEFRYDAFGRLRIRRDYSYLPASSSYLLTNEVRYVYDGMLVVQDRDANNIALVSYTRGNDLSGSLQGAGGIGGLLARTANSYLLTPNSQNAHAFYHADGNGNITAMVNTNGIVVARYNYDPYGNLLGMSGPLAEKNTYRFSSKEWNGNAGLYYYGFRFYEPNVQRWLNRDPIEEKGGINLYGFVHNDALGNIDPMGESLAGKLCTLGAKGVRRVYKGLMGESIKDAAKAVKKGEDIIASSRNSAKEIAKAAGDGQQPIHEIDHKTGSPHYHPHDRSGGHVLYGAAAALTLTHWAEKFDDGSGITTVAWMADLFNPLSIGQDIVDVKDAICGDE